MSCTVELCTDVKSNMDSLFCFVGPGIVRLLFSVVQIECDHYIDERKLEKEFSILCVVVAFFLSLQFLIVIPANFLKCLPFQSSKQNLCRLCTSSSERKHSLISFISSIYGSKKNRKEMDALDL